MNKRVAAFTLAWALVFTLVATSAPAQSVARVDSRNVAADTQSQNVSARNEGKHNEA